jgi:alkanesulfonate monooxygenase SsuD/methylene tetrahydromethanopterin reductase-like flavin-dependent oxidoreductase (luciferase family)
LKERVEAMRAIWANDEAEYHGEFVDFDPIWSWPKPVQQPGPPVILGNAGPKAIDRVVDYADGWVPIGGRADVPLADQIAELQQRAKDAGRGRIPVSLFAARPKQEHVDKLVEAGVDRAVFFIPPEPAEKILPLLDAYATLHG